MKYRKIEFCQAEYSELCRLFGEEMKHILSKLAEHNCDFPKHKLTLEVIEDYAVIYYEDKDGDREYVARRFERFKDVNDVIKIYNYIACFNLGLRASGKIKNKYRIL